MKLFLILTLFGTIFVLLGSIVEVHFTYSLMHSSNGKENPILIKKIKGLIFGFISVAVGAFIFLCTIGGLL